MIRKPKSMHWRRNWRRVKASKCRWVKWCAESLRSERCSLVGQSLCHLDCFSKHNLENFRTGADDVPAMQRHQRGRVLLNCNLQSTFGLIVFNNSHLTLILGSQDEYRCQSLNNHRRCRAPDCNCSELASGRQGGSEDSAFDFRYCDDCYADCLRRVFLPSRGGSADGWKHQLAAIDIVVYLFSFLRIGIRAGRVADAEWNLFQRIQLHCFADLGCIQLESRFCDHRDLWIDKRSHRNRHDFLDVCCAKRLGNDLHFCIRSGNERQVNQWHPANAKRRKASEVDKFNKKKCICLFLLFIQWLRVNPKDARTKRMWFSKEQLNL